MPKQVVVMNTEHKEMLSVDNFRSLTHRLTFEEQEELLEKTYKLLQECFIKV